MPPFIGIIEMLGNVEVSGPIKYLVAKQILWKNINV